MERDSGRWKSKNINRQRFLKYGRGRKEYYKRTGRQKMRLKTKKNSNTQKSREEEMDKRGEGKE